MRGQRSARTAGELTDRTDRLHFSLFRLAPSAVQPVVLCHRHQDQPRAQRSQDPSVSERGDEGVDERHGGDCAAWIMDRVLIIFCSVWVCFG